MLITKSINRKTENYSEIVALMKTAFPKNEQFPIWLLRLLAIKKNVNFTAYYDNDTFAGISYTASSNNMLFILFLAVNPNIRSKGYGSAILKHISNTNQGKAIALNIEPVVETANNYEQRKARLSFYERNGFIITDYYIKDNNENYTILCNTNDFSCSQYKDVLNKMSFGIYNPQVRKK